MAVDFGDYFWGEKNEGFGVLYHNMKCGLVATKELADYLKERAKLEEDNSKAHTKLAKQLNTTSSSGTFSPLLLALRVSTEKLAAIHNQWTHKLLDLVKEVAKYSDELQKTHKQVKDEESATGDSVKSIQDTTLMLHKSKEAYKQRCLEVEKMKRDNASTKDLEKSEAKFRKAQEEYKMLADKYCGIRDDFERKMTVSAKHFQEVEITHLKQMREFMEGFCQIVDNNNNQIGRVYQEFQLQLAELTVDNLLEQFTLSRHTGLEKPGPIEFDEEKISLASITGPPSDISDRSGNSGSDKTLSLTAAVAAAATATPAPMVCEGTFEACSAVGDNVFSEEEMPQPSTSPARSPLNAPKFTAWTVSGFLRRNRKKEKKGKKSKDESSSGGAAAAEEAPKEYGSDGEDARKSGTPTPEVDEEGYSKQPNVVGTATDPWSDFNKPQANFYSSSDESDDDTKRKIKVEIKPVTTDAGAATTSATTSSVTADINATTPGMDELSIVAGKLELAPHPNMQPRYRPKSVLNDRILSGTMRSQQRELTKTDATKSDGHIRRSHSQSQIHPPSQDLLGLTLHPIDPIDPVTTPPSQPTPSTFSATYSSPQTSSATGNSSTNKEVQDILSEFADSGPIPPALPPKQNASSGSGITHNSSVHRERISNSLIALPRPPSRIGHRLRGSQSPGPSDSAARKITRQDSGSDVNVSARSEMNESFRAAYGVSRGPSPLTLSLSDVVPLAVAFQEVCHVCFRGGDESKCQVRLIGDMMISFPAGIVQLVANHPNPSPLVFKIKNADCIESVVANKHLIVMCGALSSTESKVFEFEMKSLKELLRRQAEQNPNASYFNLDLLKYQIKAKKGAGSCPLQMVAYWKCADKHTDLRLDYKYNVHSMANPCPLLNLSIAVPISGGVTGMQSQPTGTWMADSQRALWKFPELNQSMNCGIGSLRGRFQLQSGPGSQGTIAAQFNCEGTTLSGVDFELISPGYRLSLVKRRFVSGKYICDGDASVDNRYRYATPQSINVDGLEGPTEC